MSKKVIVKHESSVGLSGLIFIVFLVLKLTHVIDWSWWWVTAPLWIPTGFITVILLILFILYICTED